MENCRNRAMQLNGMTLYTTSGKKPFDIVAVLGDRIEFVPQGGNGGKRWFPLDSIEYLCSLNLNLNAIRPMDIKKVWPNDQNTSYVASIIREIAK